MVITVWVVGGLLSLAGALTYAELAVLMPRAGGEYVFIREAYGRLWGFLYGWTRFFVASTGGLAGLAAGFAIFLNIASGGALQAHALAFSLGGRDISIGAVTLVASGAIVLVTLVNCAAVAVGGRIASVLATLKVSLVLGVGVGAFILADGNWTNYALSAVGGACEGVPAAARGGIAGFGAAMLGAMWAYNGWNEVTYVAGEVKDPSRNLPLAIIGGIGIIATLYVFANLAYFYVLHAGRRRERLAGIGRGDRGRGAVSRPGRRRPDGGRARDVASSDRCRSWRWCPRAFRTPWRSTACSSRPWAASARARASRSARSWAQAVWAIVLVFSGSYDTITDYAIFAVLIFVALATASVFVFRRRMPDAERPYRTLGYPVVPILFMLVATAIVINTLVTTPDRALAGVGLMLAGLPFYWYWSRKPRLARLNGPTAVHEDHEGTKARSPLVYLSKQSPSCLGVLVSS